MKMILESTDDVYNLLKHIESEFKRIRKELNNDSVITKQYFNFMDKIVGPWIDDQAFLKEKDIDPKYEEYITDILLDFLNNLKKR